MNRLHEHVGTQLRTFGRCAMMGTLIGLMTTQAFAASAPVVTSQPAPAPEQQQASNHSDADDCGCADREYATDSGGRGKDRRHCAA